MRLILVLVLLGLGLGYYFRDQIAPGWLGPRDGATVQIPSAMGSVERMLDRSF